MDAGDHPTRAGFGERVELHSTLDAHLFEILNVIRMLRPADQVEAILHARPDVADAAKVYSLVWESLIVQ